MGRSMCTCGRPSPRWFKSSPVSISAPAGTGVAWLEPGDLELEPEAVEPAAGSAGAAFQVGRRGVPGSGLVPGGEDQIARPARVAHALGGGVRPHAEGLVRALGDAGLGGFGALRPDAEMIERAQRELVPGGLAVHAVPAHLGAMPAGLASRQALHLVFAQGVAVAVGRGLDLPRHGFLGPVAVAPAWGFGLGGRDANPDLNFGIADGHALTRASLKRSRASHQSR